MEIFKTRRNSYEEILPRSPRRENWKYFLIIIVILLTAVTILAFAQLILDMAKSETKMFRQSAPEEEEILVNLTLGQIRGKRMVSRGGREYLAFNGVPYAKPPVGNLRFAPPEEVASWNGTLDTREFKPQCIQLHKDAEGQVGPTGSEDCLYLNIFTSKKIDELSSRRNRFPVMVYIHGGINNGNGSQYGADYFMDEDIVLVFVHYRLHVLSNLNTEDSVARGNFGIKDQVQALKWVKDHISKFGGNRRKVTLFGNSSGAMGISVHILSPMSKGLFQRTICQSGTVLYPNRIARNPRKQAIELAEEVNCSTTTNSSQALVDCLRTIDAGELTLKVRDIEFSQTIESPSETPEEDTCLPDSPLKLLQTGQINQVTSIYGVNSAENLLASLGILLIENVTIAVNENWNDFMADALELDYVTDPQNMTEILHDFYIGPNQNVTEESLTNLTDLMSDRFWVHPTKVFSGYHVQNKGRRDSVYMYYLAKEGPRSYATTPMKLFDPNDTEFGPVHADEVQFLFPNGKFPRIDLGSPYANFSQMLIKTWVNFANTGAPTLPNSDIEWVELDSTPEGSQQWLILDDEPFMGNPVAERMKLWDSFNETELYY